MFGNKGGWTLKVRLWVHRNGQKVLGPGRFELLELIDTHHSIAASAKLMSMSYRRAWGLVRSMNEAAGEALVEVAAGGAGGGGAKLTVRGQEALRFYRRTIQQLSRATRKSGRSDSRV